MHEGDSAGSLEGLLYKYLYAANGVFITARNDVFETTIPLTTIKNPAQFVRGLEVIQPDIILPKRVPASLLSRMVFLSRKALPNEILFYLFYENDEWHLYIPPQRTHPSYAKPLEDSNYVPIEIHSHNTMPAFFSAMDNRDENGLRIYGVLGLVDQPVVDFRLRVSIYGHYSVLPYQLVFNPTSEVKNG
jgi:PRTRC genetic system protein A